MLRILRKVTLSLISLVSFGLAAVPLGRDLASCFGRCAYSASTLTPAMQLAVGTLLCLGAWAAVAAMLDPRDAK
jgi:hypothetical protein